VRCTLKRRCLIKDTHVHVWQILADFGLKSLNGLLKYRMAAENHKSIFDFDHVEGLI